ncbi:MAG: dihydroorotase [Mariprofundaceae bacterium]|nr:dihydroorotase [Mariprofundaceae bacterium]
MTTLCIRQGRVIDPENHIDVICDVWIENGHISHMGHIEEVADQEINATHCVVCPGLIDMHVHLREPGEEWKEDIESASKSAVAGGVTSMCCMPNTTPCLDHAGVVHQILNRAKEVGLCRIFPIGAVSRQLKGKEITEMRDLSKAGAVAFSDDGLPIWHAGTMRKALEYASSFGYLIIQHAEEFELTKDGAINEGIVSSMLGLKGMPNEGEDCMVARDIMLTELTGGRYHVAHISSARSIEMVRHAQEKGLSVSAEAAPHHFALTELELLNFNTNAKMNPPLRTEADRMAVVKGLRDGSIAVIASDHAPHHEDDKCCTLDCAAFGIVGLETLLPVSLELVHQGHLSMSEVVAKLTSNPAKLLGLDVGTLGLGKKADIVIFNPSEDWMLDSKKLRSKSKNTPWDGKIMRGTVHYTLLGGEVVYQKEVSS